ncbi:MAG TPA: mandelate racemase/muconate lactonizing enzyme family protein [Solirubrobacteraceae bacterium]
MKLEIDIVAARMRAPFVSATGSVQTRLLALVRLEHMDGAVGFGEAAPLPSYDRVTVDDVVVALEGCREVLARGEEIPREQVLEECARLGVLPQALAALDLALWDLEGHRSGEPVWRLLGGEAGRELVVNHAIAAPDRARAAGEALAASRAGFRTLKVKVGIGDDAGRLAAVRAAAGPEVAIRLDANGAWTVDEAAASLRALSPAGLELCEQPVASLNEVSQLSELTLLPLSLDESTTDPGALDRRVCDAVCLKVARSGGITGMLESARRARASGYEVYLASSLDGPLGIAAALHAAAVIAPDRPSGLATLLQFADRDDPLPARDGRIALPDGPGLGDGLLRWYGLGD